MNKPLSTAFLMLLVCLAVPSAASAQAPAAEDSLPAYLLEEVNVEARRTPAARSDLAQQVDVVTRPELDRTPASDVADALKRTATVDVIQFPALLSGVAIRGFRPQFSGLNPRTLILLDGRPAGATNLATLDLAAVERIEVLKGPASALYGSSAMGGAINIVTRRSLGAPGGTADLAIGSFGSYRGSAVAGGTLVGALDFDLSLAATGRTSGFETGSTRLFGSGPVTKHLAAGGTLRLPETVRDTVLEHSEFASRSGSLRLGYELAPRWRVDGRAALFRGDDIENPGDLNVSAYSTRTVNDLERTTGDLALSGVAGAHALLARVFASSEVTSYYDDADDPSFVSSRSPNRWRGLQLQDVVSLGRHTLTAGVDQTSSEATSQVFSAPDTPTSPFSADAAVRSLAAFSEARLDLSGDGSLVATVGGRVDRVAFEVEDATLADGSTVEGNVETHAVFNPSGGLVLQPGGGVRLHMSAGRSFVTPGAFNVAGYSESPAGPSAVTVTRGNPDLNPESGRSWDVGVGVRRPGDGVEADITYFHTRVRNRVAAVPVVFDDVRLTPRGDTIKAITTYSNADEGEIRGLEGALSYDFGARRGYPFSLRLFGTATRMLSARETTAGVTTDVRNVADLTVVGGVAFDDLDRIGVRLSGRYVGERLDTDFTDFLNPGDVRYPEFFVIDLSSSVRLARGYRLSLEVANVADENYYEVRGYTMPGREVRVGVGVTW
jgi:vitamin B12 transporter